jgi:hypothetical protein
MSCGANASTTMALQTTPRLSWRDRKPLRLAAANNQANQAAEAECLNTLPRLTTTCKHSKGCTSWLHLMYSGTLKQTVNQPTGMWGNLTW